MFLIRGRVHDHGGHPQSGASVYIVTSPVAIPDIAQMTGADGSFLLALPAPGKYVIAARSDAGSGRAQVEAQASGEAEVGISLQPD